MSMLKLKTTGTAESKSRINGSIPIQTYYKYNIFLITGIVPKAPAKTLRTMLNFVTKEI